MILLFSLILVLTLIQCFKLTSRFLITFYSSQGFLSQVYQYILFISGICCIVCRACLRANMVYVGKCLHANVLLCQCANVLTYQKHANFLFLHASVPINVPTSRKVKVCPMFQLGMPICQTACQFCNLTCQRAKWCASFSKIPLTKC